MKRVCERHSVAYEIETGCLDCIALEEEKIIKEALEDLREWSLDRSESKDAAASDAAPDSNQCGFGYDANGGYYHPWCYSSAATTTK